MDLFPVSFLSAAFSYAAVFRAIDGVVMSSSALSTRIKKMAPVEPESSSTIRLSKPSIPSAAQKKSWGASFVGVASVAAIVFGFMIRRQELIVPGEGLGYKLGIAGGLMMLALLF